ncbi:DUF6168 family protein [Costertonia aggregata]|uniref:Uncharacterized protein n=1 Tax=Costertonia aggregata TaxID=343403 RepID=A0A7H9AP24_9FLAO|nr:DUF6168 family protein [Costertonia aggregata]QLG45209.1 hypothetical protein HYG79_07555 [Costertonia aggregata]
MIKTLLTYVLVFGLLFLGGFYLHAHYLFNKETVTFFSLQKVYVFHSICSFVICTFLLLVSKSGNFKHQLGFFYLGAFVFKFVAFGIAFSPSLFGEIHLSQIEKISLLVPVLIFLIPEVYFVVKILGKLNLDTKKKLY